MNRAARLGSFVLLAMLLAAVPAAGADKYVIHDDTRINDTRTPAKGKALVYFVRTQRMGRVVPVQLMADGKPLGWIKRRTFIAREFEPGKHEMTALSAGAALLEAEFLPDRIYYVKVAITMGFSRLYSHFEVVRAGSEAMKEFMKVKAKLREITTTAEGLAWYEKNRKDIDEWIGRERRDRKATELLKPEDGYEQPL